MPAEKTTPKAQETTAPRRGIRSFRSKAEVTPVLEPELTTDTRGITASKGRATPSRRQRDEAAEDEGGFAKRTFGGILEYFDGVQSEISKVSWPSRIELQRLTIVVVLTLIVSSIVLGIISIFFTELFRIGLQTPAVLMGFMVISLVVGFFINRWYSGQQTVRRY